MRIQAQIIALLSCLFFSLSLHAQDPNYRFGKAEEEDVRMSSYELDPDAAAVILYHRGDRYYDFINNQLRLVYVYHKRVKILAESALGLADVEVPYYSYSKNESIVEVKGITYNVGLGGKIEEQKLDKDAIFKEEINELWSVLKFNMPNVVVGSVIEYTYKIYSYDFGSMRTWYFQDEYPTVYNETSLGRPKGFYYSPTILGEYYAIDKKTEMYRSVSLPDGDRDVYTVRNVPAFVEVPYLRAVRNHLLRLDWKLTSIQITGTYKNYNESWDQLCTAVLENNDYKVARSPGRLGKDIVEAALSGETEAVEIASTIYSTLRKKYNWNNRFSYYPSPRLAALDDKKEGNSASLNLTLLAGLKEAGLDAYPVLVSTRNHGIVQNVFPNLRQFNHMIVRVVLPDNKHLLLDLASANTPVGMLPIHDLNDMGMQLSSEGASWISLKPGHKAEHNSRATMEIDVENASLKGELKCSDKEYAALSSRKFFHSNDIGESDKDYIHKKVMADFGDFELGDFAVENAKDITEDFNISCNFSTQEYLQMAGHHIYLKPMLHLAEKENPFKQEERKYLIDFTTPIHKKVIMLYTIPEGWVAESTPETLKIAIPEHGAVFTYQVMSLGNQMQVMSDFRINEAVFKPEMYAYLRAFMDQVVAKQNEQIVLKKQ